MDFVSAFWRLICVGFVGFGDSSVDGVGMMRNSLEGCCSGRGVRVCVFSLEAARCCG